MNIYNKFYGAINKLEQSNAYNLSLNEPELFNLNFINRLIESYPAYMIKVLNNLSGAELQSIEETEIKDNFIAVYGGNTVIFILFKGTYGLMNDWADQFDELDSFFQKIADAKNGKSKSYCAAIRLSFYAPGEEYKSCRLIDFSEFGHALVWYLKLEKFAKRDMEMIRDYFKYIFNIHSLIFSFDFPCPVDFHNTDENQVRYSELFYVLDNPKYTALKKIKMGKIWQEKILQDFAHDFYSKVYKKLGITGYIFRDKLLVRTGAEFGNGGNIESYKILFNLLDSKLIFALIFKPDRIELLIEGLPSPGKELQQKEINAQIEAFTRKRPDLFEYTENSIVIRPGTSLKRLKHNIPRWLAETVLLIMK